MNDSSGDYTSFHASSFTDSRLNLHSQLQVSDIRQVDSAFSSITTQRLNPERTPQLGYQQRRDMKSKESFLNRDGKHSSKSLPKTNSLSSQSITTEGIREPEKFKAQNILPANVYNRTFKASKIPQGKRFSSHSSFDQFGSSFQTTESKNQTFQKLRHSKQDLQKKNTEDSKGAWKSIYDSKVKPSKLPLESMSQRSNIFLPSLEQKDPRPDVLSAEKNFNTTVPVLETFLINSDIQNVCKQAFLTAQAVSPFKLKPLKPPSGSTTSVNYLQNNTFLPQVLSDDNPTLKQSSLANCNLNSSSNILESKILSPVSPKESLIQTVSNFKTQNKPILVENDTFRKPRRLQRIADFLGFGTKAREQSQPPKIGNVEVKNGLDTILDIHTIEHENEERSPKVHERSKSLLSPTASTDKIEVKTAENKETLQDTKKVQKRRIDKEKIAQVTPLLFKTNRPQKQQDNCNDKILCQSLNAEPFWRRSIAKLGWQEVAQKEKASFHIRFNIGDLKGADADLKQNQMYNHFPDNREVTTKSGLCRNLWQNCFSDVELRVNEFFPRCYDLSDSKQSEEFVNDFNQTAILSIVKIMAQHFLAHKDIETLLTLYQRKKFYLTPVTFKKRFVQQCDDRDKERTNLLGSDQVRWAIQYAKNVIDSRKLNDKTTRKVKTKSFYKASEKLSETQLQSLQEFLSLLVEQGIPSNLNFTTLEQVNVCKMYRKLQKHNIQFGSIDGTHNSWIVKPSYNSRGIGIYITRHLAQIYKGKKEQQRVVQKYIESPLLLEGKKFDFRQWVLVNSWEPLDVCVFSSAYLKLCSQTFDLKNLGEVFRHLSNYSIQKKEAEEAGDTVMNVEQFERFMKQQGHGDFTWQKLTPQIHDVVWRTLKAVQETQEQRSNCFEVYGLDLVLDSQLKLWLIEVNLSPACSERTPWLTQMLDESSFDLLNKVQQRLLTLQDRDFWTGDLKQLRKQIDPKQQEKQRTSTYLNNDTFYEQNAFKDRWIRLEQSKQEILDFYSAGPVTGDGKTNLEVQGKPVVQKVERFLDKSYRRETNAWLIQKVWRGSRARKAVQRDREYLASLKLNRAFKVFLCQKILLRLRKKRAALIVQKNLRRRIAQNFRQSMIRDADFKRKNSAANTIQCLYRSRVARKELLRRQKQLASLLVQRFLKGFLARKAFINQRHYLTMVRRLQRYLKRRFLGKKQAANHVQRVLRGFVVRKKVEKLLKITRAIQTMTKVFRRRKFQSGLVKFTLNVKVIHIQSHLRRLIIQRKLKLRRQYDARKTIKKLFVMNTLKLLSKFAGDLRKERFAKATLVQRYLRGHLSRKIAQRMRLDIAATFIQKNLRRRLALNTAIRYKLEIDAAVLIQTIFRQILARKHLVALKKKQSEVEAKTIEAANKAQSTKKKFESFVRTQFDLENYKPIAKFIKLPTREVIEPVSESKLSLFNTSQVYKPIKLKKFKKDVTQVKHSSKAIEVALSLYKTGNKASMYNTGLRPTFEQMQKKQRQKQRPVEGTKEAGFDSLSRSDVCFQTQNNLELLRSVHDNSENATYPKQRTLKALHGKRQSCDQGLIENFSLKQQHKT